MEAATSAVEAPALRPRSSQTDLFATMPSSWSSGLPSSPGFLPGALPPSAASLSALFSSTQAESAVRICSSSASSPRPSAAAIFLMSSFMLVSPP